MNLYQLNDKETDHAFLSNIAVKCTAVLNERELIKLQNDKKLVVQLSNRAKYMGKIIDSSFEIKNGIASGYLTIIRF
ncbi:hypothetical protein [Chryseosolibacter indicus]|uniref:Uncharacterized protein n=1 Tax=Chryseosolibacter indicus TaxID=2782351 RepID=A0ABS5VW88_9BACT|nr:hypothetical protein [Chryseosolibacter indicus]MBT1705702.1 hypothetical protein [Chryseosolibacter indicus]